VDLLRVGALPHCYPQLWEVGQRQHHPPLGICQGAP